MAECRQCPKKKKENLLSTYTDPRAPGALGGLRRFARAQRLSQAQARDALRKCLAFTLHCPPRRQFKMAPVMILNIDQQWVADLVVLASEPGRAVPVDSGGRVVEIRMGLPHQMQDGCRTLESFREYRGRRPSSSNVTDGQR